MLEALAVVSLLAVKLTDAAIGGTPEKPSRQRLSNSLAFRSRRLVAAAGIRGRWKNCLGQIALLVLWLVCQLLLK